jgi:voltage-gated potassium channel Kch
MSPKLLKEADEVEKDLARFRPIRRLFLLDVMADKESHPVFIWAATALLVGTIAFHYLEGWSFLDALYFSVITLATVGYGDLTPTTPIAKIFTIVYVINGLSILLALFDRIRVVRMNNLEARQQRRKNKNT